MEMAKLLMVQKREIINKCFCSVFFQGKKQGYMHESSDNDKILTR